MTRTQDLLDLLPELAKRSAEIEQTRGLPADVLDALVAAGCFRMAVPARFGGTDLPLVDILRVVETLATADGATGWTVGQAAIAQVILAHLPEPTVAELYTAGPDLLGAGAVAPKGRAQRTDDGWRVSGQWPFVTGCRHAEWVYLQCLLVENNQPVPGENGLPRMVLAVLPAAEVRIVDTWDVLGLRGTGSHDVRVHRAVCPPSRVVPASEAGYSVRGNALRLPARDQGGLVVAASACGVARAALDTLVGLVTDGKRPSFSTSKLAESPLLHDRLGEATTTLAAARALLYTETEAADAVVRTGGTLSTVDRARLRTAGPRVVTLATEVVDLAHRLASGTAAFNDFPMQRHLRDIHTVTQHFSAGRDHYTNLGRLLVGQDRDAGMF